MNLQAGRKSGTRRGTYVPDAKLPHLVAQWGDRHGSEAGVAPGYTRGRLRKAGTLAIQAGSMGRDTLPIPGRPHLQQERARECGERFERDRAPMCPCACGDRPIRPLFADARGAAYTHAFLDRMLKAALTFQFGAKVASLFTWHSYRSGLATALHAAKVDGGMVQLTCRWMCPESLHVYRRMGTQEHAQLIQKAMHAKVDLIQSVNVPKVVGDEGCAELVGALTDGRNTEDQKEYEAALSRILGEEAKKVGEGPRNEPPLPPTPSPPGDARASLRPPRPGVGRRLSGALFP
ncbi:MAG: hypothetical protein SGPRY_010387 [Prymnesium sp.]